MRYDAIYDPMIPSLSILDIWRWGGVDSPSWDKTSIWYLLESCTKSYSSYNISSLCLYKIVNTIWLKLTKKKIVAWSFLIQDADILLKTSYNEKNI